MNHVYLAIIIVLGLALIVNLKRKPAFEKAIKSTCNFSLYISIPAAILSLSISASLVTIAFIIPSHIGLPSSTFEKLTIYATKLSIGIPLILAAINLKIWAKKKLHLHAKNKTIIPLAKATTWITIAIATLTLI